MSKSGLEQMDELRARARRQVPAARHSPRRAPQPTHGDPELSKDDDPIGDAPERTTAEPPSQVRDRADEAQGDKGPARRRSRVRATQVHLDEVSEDHLTNIKKRAVMADVDVTNSAVLRLALAEFVERHGYDRIVAMFDDDDGRLRRGRPRR